MVGVRWILGPSLDQHSNAQPRRVDATGKIVITKTIDLLNVSLLNGLLRL
jgi:hypothetical protein